MVPARPSNYRRSNLAVHNECEELVSDLLHFKKTSAGADVCFPDLLWPMDDGGAAGPSNAVVIRLPQTADGADARLGEEVCCKVAEPLLCDHNVWLELRHVFAHVLDPVLLDFEERSPASSRC